MKAIPNREWASVDTLYAQYYLLCEEMSRIHTWIRMGHVLLPSFKYTCNELARQRYHQERKYVRTLMVEKGAMYFTQNLESYLINYFLDNRFDALVDKYTSLESCFGSVL